MGIHKFKPQRRRLKSEGKWPKWLRSPHLLRWIIEIGLASSRVLRLVLMLFDIFHR